MNKFIYSSILFVLLLVSCGNVQKVETLTIASRQADCIGVAPQKCLLVKENGQGDWTFFYQGIEGFSYEPGYEYVIEIKKETVEAPPADGSSLRYIFVKEVSKEKKDSEGLPEIPVQFTDQSLPNN